MKEVPHIHNHPLESNLRDIHSLRRNFHCIGPDLYLDIQFRGNQWLQSERSSRPRTQWKLLRNNTRGRKLKLF